MKLKSYKKGLLWDLRDSEHGRIGAGRIRYRAVAHHVVHNDHCAATGNFERPDKVFGYSALVGINEDQVEGTALFGDEIG